jgi:hypothetical protein
MPTLTSSVCLVYLVSRTASPPAVPTQLHLQKHLQSRKTVVHLQLCNQLANELALRRRLQHRHGRDLTSPPSSKGSRRSGRVALVIDGDLRTRALTCLRLRSWRGRMRALRRRRRDVERSGQLAIKPSVGRLLSCAGEALPGRRMSVLCARGSWRN